VVEVDIGPVIGGQPRGLSPAGEREQVGVGHREGVAQEEVVRGELRVDPGIARLELRLGGLDPAPRQPGVEQGNEALVDLGREESEHLLEAVAIDASVRRGETRFRLQVGQILQDGGALPQDGAAAEIEGRDIAVRIDGDVIRARLRPVRRGIDAAECQIEVEFTGDDMGRKRAARGDAIQFHRQSLKTCGNVGAGIGGVLNFT
jgi:hypothetical protein